MISGVIAIIGRPNVGKSTLFNRIVGERTSIVLDNPGVTRDRIYRNASWLTKQFKLIDTGGIALNKDFFQEKIKIQAEIAINEADLIIFVVDGQTGLLEEDLFIANLLKKSRKEIIVAINKIDSFEKSIDNYEFYKLGIENCFFVSSTHGIGVGDLLDKAVSLLPQNETQIEDDYVKLAIIGRPNVGKSSLVNSLTGNERVIVSNIPGTTRDSIDQLINYEDKNYLLIDTAGLKKRGKIIEAVDKFSSFRAHSAIEKSDICLLVIDGFEGLLEQDKHVLHFAIKNGKAAIILINKVDLINGEQKLALQKTIKETMPFSSYLPVVFISALNKSGIKNLFAAIDEVNISRTTKIATSILNEIILDAQMINPSHKYNGGNFKIFYGLQENISPPTFTFFVNNPNYLHFSYQRYIENKIRESFGFIGTPIDFKFKRKI